MVIGIGTKLRTTKNGMFNAGDNVVRVEWMGEDWIVARDTNGKTYSVLNQNLSKLNEWWQEFVVQEERR